MKKAIIIILLLMSFQSINANEIFNLIKIPNLEVFKLESKNKIKYLSSKRNFTIGVTKNITCDKANENNLKKKYEIIKKNLDIYNYEFLKKNNIKFVVLCENLSISGIGTAGIPDKQKRTLILDINFNPKYFERVIHHEVFHMIYDSNPNLFDENVWRDFNDKSFQYAGCSICSDSIGLDGYKKTDGFITEYSKTIPSEDMAEIYSFIIKKENILIKLAEEDEKLKKKITFIKNSINKIDSQIF